MSFYLIDDIEQGTPEWHEWRKGVIGASEAVIVMGENRWKGRQQLVDEKLGRCEPFSGNAATREGNALEQPAREALEKKFGQSLFATIVQDATEPFLAASLDAINKPNNQIFEIKCGFRTYEMIESYKEVPNYYIAQVQHMLMVTQMESLQFAAYRPSKPLITFEVFRNEVYIRELRRKEKAFILELESQGLQVQNEFRGKKVGQSGIPRKLAKNPNSIQQEDSHWVVDAGHMKYWDGSTFLEGELPGLYELNGESHYWNGEEWTLPKEPGFYMLNGDEYYWDGRIWKLDY